MNTSWPILSYYPIIFFEIRMKTKEMSFSAASIPDLRPNQPPRVLASRVSALGR
jgi:hypothetical protein